MLRQLIFNMNVCKKFNLFHMYLIYWYHGMISIGYFFLHQRQFIYLHGRHILHLYPYRTDKIFFDLRHHILQFNKSILRKISFYKIFRENKYCILLLLFFFCLSFFLFVNWSQMNLYVIRERFPAHNIYCIVYYEAIQSRVNAII